MVYSGYLSMEDLEIAIDKYGEVAKELAIKEKRAELENNRCYAICECTGDLEAYADLKGEARRRDYGHYGFESDEELDAALNEIDMILDDYSYVRVEPHSYAKVKISGYYKDVQDAVGCLGNSIPDDPEFFVEFD
jgi:hypothetical protein